MELCASHIWDLQHSDYTTSTITIITHNIPTPQASNISSPPELTETPSGHNQQPGQRLESSFIPMDTWLDTLLPTSSTPIQYDIESPTVSITWSVDTAPRPTLVIPRPQTPPPTTTERQLDLATEPTASTSIQGVLTNLGQACTNIANTIYPPVETLTDSVDHYFCATGLSCDPSPSVMRRLHATSTISHRVGAYITSYDPDPDDGCEFYMEPAIAHWHQDCQKATLSRRSSPLHSDH